MTPDVTAGRWLSKLQHVPATEFFKATKDDVKEYSVALEVFVTSTKQKSVGLLSCVRCDPSPQNDHMLVHEGSSADVLGGDLRAAGKTGRFGFFLCDFLCIF